MTFEFIPIWVEMNSMDRVLLLVAILAKCAVLSAIVTQLMSVSAER